MTRTVLSVVGARPQFVKLAPIAAALTRAGHRHVIVHTGQHYDARLSDVFFRDLGIPAPDVHLDVGSATHGVQTGTMMAELDPVLRDARPDCVLVYGDTNSTLAAALCAVKMHFPLAHLEAGLRSCNRRMPEEHNRVLTDHASDLCLAPTVLAMSNLAAEGLAHRARLVGDVMTDVLLQTRDAVRGSVPELPVGVEQAGGYYVATVHRAENTDDGAVLARIVQELAGLDRPVLLAAHPRLSAAADRHGVDLAVGAIHLVEPLPYPALVNLVLHGEGVITDSGGLQKEAFLLGRPCTTLRTETEWTETVELGWNVLVDVASGQHLADAVRRPPPAPVTAEPYGDGRAADRVVAAIEEFLPAPTDGARP